MVDQLLVISVVLLWVIVLLNFVLTLALIRKLNNSSALNAEVARQDGLKPGDPAPDFTAETLRGETVSLSTFLGRDTALVFVSPTCGPCRSALPRFEAALPHARRSGAELVLVSIADADATRAFADEFNISLPVLVAPRPENTFMQDYKFNSTPSYCLIDAQGKVRLSGYPSFEGGEWRSLVDSWQQGTPQLASLVPSKGGGA
ncbi:MAG TPA: redoxin domain-containing protein [Chloroflexia bacterium]|jgi:peroxiredoxin